MGMWPIVNIGGYEVEVLPNVPHQTNLAANFPCTWIMSGRWDDNVPLLERGILRCNVAFLHLSQPTQEALLLHEVGHRMCGHLHSDDARYAQEIDRMNALAMVDKPDPCEMEADQYAITKVGLEAFVMAIREYVALVASVQTEPDNRKNTLTPRQLHWERLYADYRRDR